MHDIIYIGGWGSETGLSVPPNREIVFRVRDVIATRSCVSARRDSGVARAGGTQMSCSCSPPFAPPRTRPGRALPPTRPGRVTVRPGRVPDASRRVPRAQMLKNIMFFNDFELKC